MDTILSIIFGVVLSILSSFISHLLSKNKINKIRINVNEKVKISGESVLSNVEFDSNDIGLKHICDNIEAYFNKISPNNKVLIKILKCDEKNNAINIYSNSEKDESIQYILDENTSMTSVMKYKDSYYNNNIQYFLKHGKPYFEQHKLWTDNYKSIMCFPIRRNEKIIGLLLIGLINPLNELIDFENIKEHIEQICDLLSKNNMFIETSNQ